MDVRVACVDPVTLSCVSASGFLWLGVGMGFTCKRRRGECFHALLLSLVPVE